MALFETGLVKNKFKKDKVIKKLEQLSREKLDESVYADVELPQGAEIYRHKLGTIGSGNHFAELQEVCEVFNHKVLNDIGVKKNEVFILVHSGSRQLGESILRKYVDHPKEGLKVGSDKFNSYMREHEEAVEFAIVNRALIAKRLTETLKLSKSRKLLDSTHNSITMKNWEGREYYIHRKGVSSSDQGYIVIAGSRGSKSYIVKPKENLYDYAFSVAHGAGRKWPRQGCKERLEHMYAKNMPKSSMKKSLYKGVEGNKVIYKNQSLLYEEAPEAYKNIERVIDDMLQFNMIEVVASLNPLVTYKA